MQRRVARCVRPSEDRGRVQVPRELETYSVAIVLCAGSRRRRHPEEDDGNFGIGISLEREKRTWQTRTPSP
jgi:hypothetical protein